MPISQNGEDMAMMIASEKSSWGVLVKFETGLLAVLVLADSMRHRKLRPCSLFDQQP
jgi:hypothetical protein